jgi:hypothetical protein
MGEFDPIKAYREEIEGAATTARSIARLKDHAAEELAHAEQKYNDVLKSDAFMKDCLAKMRERLRQMESEAERKAGGG